MIEKYYNIIMIAYLITGFIMSFDVCYYDKKKGKDNGLLDTGIKILLLTVCWLPAIIYSIYAYWLKGLYEIITEEEK